MFFFGGDVVMDSLAVDRSRLDAQWSIFQDVVRTNLATPAEYCLGNHDVWGWGERAKYQNEPQFGKPYALDRFELQKPYRSFDRAGWHFVFLDSTYPLEGDGYTARLDDEQFEWLADDLAATDKPVLIFSHIPILAACAYFHGDNESTGNWRVPGAWMHLDARRIKDLFLKHSNVKLCASGHMHLRDHVQYNGVDYVCNGAVCGNWWHGPFQECPSGYALIDLFEDGTFQNAYIDYGWQP